MNNDTGNQRRGNMYALSAQQWNPFCGCRFGCTYCQQSFQRQAKRQRRRCLDCYEFTPHQHPERLETRLPRTGYMQFIFTCASGDIAYCSTDFLVAIAARMKQQLNTTFLVQSKAPATFARIQWSRNVILGTTIETNRDALAATVSSAPPPSKRFHDLAIIDHPLKMVTVEPVMRFDLLAMLDWIERINPVMVWLGYDSKRAHLPEPPLRDFMDLYWHLGTAGFTTILKTVRPTRDQ